MVAGVYWNRLRLGMPLQADPTVQYAIEARTGERKPRLYYKDLAIPSPYNTYLHPGLPPGPINSPGIASIHAALYPDSVPYLYFVAGMDGHHLFSRTLAEHARAVAMARRQRIAEKRARPGPDASPAAARDAAGVSGSLQRFGIPPAAASTSGAPRIPDTTATPVAPAAMISGTSSGRTPPIASRGRAPASAGDRCEPAGAQRRTGVLLGPGRPPRADAPVVGGLRRAPLPRRAHRSADHRGRAEDHPRQRGGQVIRSEMDAEPGGGGHVGPVVDQHRHRQRIAESAGELEQGPRADLLEPELDRGDSPGHGRPADARPDPGRPGARRRSPASGAGSSLDCRPWTPDAPLRLQGFRGATTVEQGRGRRDPRGHRGAAAHAGRGQRHRSGGCRQRDLHRHDRSRRRPFPPAPPAGWDGTRSPSSTPPRSRSPVPSPLHPRPGPRLQRPAARSNQARLSPRSHRAPPRSDAVKAGAEPPCGSAAGAPRAGPQGIPGSIAPTSSTTPRPGTGPGRRRARPLHRTGALLPPLRDPPPPARALDAPGGWRLVARAPAGRPGPPPRHRRHRLATGARRRRRPSLPRGRSLRPLAGRPAALRRTGNDAARDSRGPGRAWFIPRGFCFATTSACGATKG